MMKMDRKARLLALWVGLLGLVLGIVQVSPGGIFLPLPLYMAIILAVFLLSLGVYAYQQDRLTPFKIVTVALSLLVIFSTPIIIKPFMGWDW
jgi:hypothetical protein